MRNNKEMKGLKNEILFFASFLSLKIKKIKEEELKKT